MERNTIICGDALEVMRQMEDESVDLVVTSPPYDSLRSYDGFEWDFEAMALEIYRVLSFNSTLVWIVGDSTVGGNETLTSFKQALYFRDVANFLMWDTMIWKKLTPGHFHKRYTPDFQYMFILTKGEPKTFNGQTRPNKHGGLKGGGGMRHKGFEPNGGAIVKEVGLYENVWEIQGGSSTKDRNGHPAAFPEELIRRHILTWSNEYDLVLDPFCGSGTTPKVARELKRDYIGIDISEKYVRMTNERLYAPAAPKEKREDAPKTLKMF